MKNLVKKYLQLNQYGNQMEEFDDLFQSHPNYPSLYAITDTLNLLSVENITVRIPKEQIEELPKEFLAIYNNQLVLVKKTSEKITIENENIGKKELSYTEFLGLWNGIILAIEPNNKIVQTNKKSLTWLLYTLPFIALLLLSIFFNKNNLNSITAILISIFGLVASIFILQEKFGIKNEISSKFCNINPNTSCNSVITSKNSKINNYFNFTDLPLLFFGASFLYLILQPIEATFVIGLISTLSVPILIYSIWIQKFQLKKWCVLCLLVSSLLFISSGLFLFSNYKIFSNWTLDINLSYLLFSVITITSIWLFLKPILESKYKLENNNNELSKFKRDFKIFEFLSKDIAEYEDFGKLKGITFGNNDAHTQLTLILSPSCGHCHKAFEDAYTLFQKFPEKTYINILFNINPNNNDNPFKTVVENLLALNENNPKTAQEAIIDWHINNLELENWIQKWYDETPHMLVNQQIQNQYYWCVKNEFNYTPVKIINNKLFPEGYEISELKYFINDFEQVAEIEKSLVAV